MAAAIATMLEMAVAVAGAQEADEEMKLLLRDWMDTAVAVAAQVEVWPAVLVPAEAQALSFFDSRAPFPPMR